MRLITIRFSHFCEKARWALDRYAVPYEEEGHLPAFHIPAVRRVSRGGTDDRISTAMSTPVLVLDDGKVLHDSSAIVRWVSDRYGDGALYPNDDAARWERALHDRLAPHARRVAYGAILRDRAMLGELAARNVGGWESTALRAALPLVRAALRRKLGINPTSVARSVAIVDEELARVEEALADRPFLAGDAFSAADLAFACAAAPALVVGHDEGYGAILPALDALPADFRALVDGWRDRPAGRFALRLFREHRGTRALPYGARIPDASS